MREFFIIIWQISHQYCCCLPYMPAICMPASPHCSSIRLYPVSTWFRLLLFIFNDLMPWRQIKMGNLPRGAWCYFFSCYSRCMQRLVFLYMLDLGKGDSQEFYDLWCGVVVARSCGEGVRAVSVVGEVLKKGTSCLDIWLALLLYARR